MKISNTIKVALNAADGTVMIMSFITDDKHGYTNEPTTENIQKEIDSACNSLDSIKLPIQSWSVIDPSEIPTDRTYRNAWHRPNDKIEHNIPIAKELHRGILRENRAVLLAQLDIEYQRADETGDTTLKQSIALKKQKLRDVTKHPDIDAAQTVDDLKLITIETHGV